jgi:hypothetical protein
LLLVTRAPSSNIHAVDRITASAPRTRDRMV